MASWRRGTGTRVAADDKTLNICIPVAAVYSNEEGTIDLVVCLIVMINRLVDFITERTVFFSSKSASTIWVDLYFWSGWWYWGFGHSGSLVRWW